LNGRLLNYKRVHGIVVFEEDFPRTASMKIKRNLLAESLAKLDRATVVKSL
jgi:acyl-coenzyme A synthetase/AMP-(fatty) acid ligase